MKKKNISENLTKALLQLNFTEKEILTYLSLLENGASTVQDISRTTGVNRVSVYSALEELKQKGLVAESRKGKKKLFVAESPDNINQLIEKKREAVKKEGELLQNTILPILKAIDINQENKPQVKFFEGLDGINKIFDEYILKNKNVINCGSYETATKAVSREIETLYFKNIKERKIFHRMILEDTPLNHEFAEVGKGISHIKFFPPETKVSADIVVSGNLTALISYDKITATLIEDKSIAETIKVYLEFMWERL
ncbi:MAG: helix-turn-helix domain-containing protein [Candidatus Moraniibacteriota bacterium]